MGYSLNKVYFDEETNNIFFVTNRNSCRDISRTLDMLRKTNKKFSFARNIDNINFVLSYNSTASEITEAVTDYMYYDINFTFTKGGFVFCGDEMIARKLYRALTKEEIFPRMFCETDKAFVYIPA